jgi:coenzyme Q-binding protein COQ10
MPEARKSIEINVPRENMLSVITDFEKYPEFLTDMKSARILSQTGNVYVAAFEIKILKSITYTLRLDVTPPTGLVWSLVESNMMHYNSGGWILEEQGPKRCRATYFIEIKLGRLIPGTITDKLTEVSLPKTLENFKKRAEILFLC